MAPDGTIGVSFVVPCYNEALTVAKTVQEIGAAASAATLSSFEIVIVNDCSTDDTGKVVAALAAGDPHIVPVSNAHNLGFGGAYKEGVKRATGEFVIMIPGDNTHPADGITPILRERGNADIVVPFAGNPEVRSLFRRITSTGFTSLMNLLFGMSLPYYNGLVLHRTALLKKIEIETDSFAYQAEALVKLIRRGATYTTVAVDIRRDQGSSRAFRPENLYLVFKAITLLRWSLTWQQ